MLKFIDVLFLGFALSADSFLVAVSNSLTVNQLKLNRILLASLTFALFHFIFPLLGYYVGRELLMSINQYGFLLAALVFLFLAVKAFLEKGEEEDSNLNHFQILYQAVATSIDALIVGLTLSFSTTSIFVSANTISVIVFFVSLTGFFIGKKIKKISSLPLNWLAGFIFLFLALKTVLGNI